MKFGISLRFSSTSAIFTLKNYFASSDPHHGIQFIPSDILSGKPSGILSGILSGISSGILHVISSDIRPGISSDILSGISSDILSGISSDILSHILSGILFGIRHSIWLCSWRGPRRAESRRLRSGEATLLRISPVEVRRGPHAARPLAGWGPARPTAIKSWQRRSGEGHSDRELAEEVRRGGEEGRAEEEAEEKEAGRLT